MDEIELIKKRYANRKFEDRYSFLNPDVYLKIQERQRKLIELLREVGKSEFKKLKVLEIGCGTGTNLVELLLLGFTPEFLSGIELLEDRIETARKLLPPSVELILGNAAETEINKEFDIIYLSTVYSSILDNQFKRKLSEKIWEGIKSGGGVLWYDFIYNNPWNPDVQGINIKAIRKLFPHGKILKYKITLAPPLARKIVKINKNLYSFFNLFPPLRTHLLCWIQKI